MWTTPSEIDVSPSKPKRRIFNGMERGNNSRLMEWREVTIPEYKGLYEVSEYGHIKSLNYRGHGLAKLVKTKIDKAGYVHVRLHKDGKQHQVAIHRLVALAFVTNDDPIVRTEINHKDGNKSNNHYSNLEWVTRSENNLHAFKLGLRRRLRGILNPNYKHGRYVEACND